MGIIRATAYPSRYAEPAYWEKMDASIGEANREWPETVCRGKLYASFNIAGAPWHDATAQREIAQALGRAMDVKPVYKRHVHGNVYDRGEYTVGGWLVHKVFVETGLYALDDLPDMLRTLQSLAECGYSPDGMITLHYMPERFDLPMALNACIILEARRELIERALGFEEEAMLIVDEDLVFNLPLEAFSLPIIEACACLLCQVSAMAMATKKARMKPCGMVNPKYQMRTWLLRLGFIGKKFERPRHTLLDRLEGNAAFFDDTGKQKAKDKRRQQKAMALM